MTILEEKKITQKIKILCVDDEADLLYLNSNILRMAGYEVLEASTGTECLRIVRDEKPDLVILDVVLPDINGVDVCKTIKTDPELQDTFVLLISGIRTSSQRQVEGFQTGADGYIVRPISGRDLRGRVHDLLRLKKSEMSLKKSREQYREIVENANSIIIRIDKTGRITFFNEFAQKLFGYKEEEVAGRLITETILPKTDVSGRNLQDMIGDILHHPEKYERNENENMTKDGRWIWVTWTNKALYDDKGEFIGILSIGQDITDRKAAEEALKEAKREADQARYLAEAANTAKSDFLANMSHELTTPLNSIIGFSQVLQDELYGGLNEKQKEYISDIINSGMHLLTLINDILDLSKVETYHVELRPSRILLKDALRSTVTMFREKALELNIRLNLDMEPDAEIEMDADPGMLKQIIFNLLSNALKFTPEGGSVHVAARRVTMQDTGYMMQDKSIIQDENIVHPESCILNHDKDFVEISVADTGIGIKPENMNKLFQAFMQLESPYSKKYPGTGLGLVLTKRLIELHRGKIWVESEYGKGSKFNFVIPIKQGG